MTVIHEKETDANRKSHNNSDMPLLTRLPPTQTLTISNAIVAAPIRRYQVDGVYEHFSEQQTTFGVGIVEEG
jgi:hypothetical protein